MSAPNVAARALPVVVDPLAPLRFLDEEVVEVEPEGALELQPRLDHRRALRNGDRTHRIEPRPPRPAPRDKRG